MDKLSRYKVFNKALYYWWWVTEVKLKLGKSSKYFSQLDLLCMYILTPGIDSNWSQCFWAVWGGGGGGGGGAHWEQKIVLEGGEG